jgi:DNA-binding transcriptional MerR regulator
MTVGELGRRFSLSRSTLLYYDRLGLLRPGQRRANGYREYTETDAKRLAQIAVYRQAGLPLREIRDLLDKPGRKMAAVLERQLYGLAEQIDVLRRRQRLIVGLLKKRQLLERVQVMNRKTWVELLRASGFTDADLRRWHQDFERLDPARHQRFLEFLGIADGEIARIRAWSRPPPPPRKAPGRRGKERRPSSHRSSPAGAAAR